MSVEPGGKCLIPHICYQPSGIMRDRHSEEIGNSVIREFFSTPPCRGSIRVTAILIFTTDTED